MNDAHNTLPQLSFFRSRAARGLALVLCLHVVACCLSLILVADFYKYLQLVIFDETRLFTAALYVGPFAVVAILFAFNRFSFGYLLGFYFYTMILGFLWLAAFSKLQYNHTLAAASAFASALAFLLPALFITSPIRQRFILPARALDLLLSAILILATATIAVGAFYNFRLIGVGDIYGVRDGLEFPALLRYAIGATVNALLPFAFACFVAKGKRWRAAAALLLMVLFYPITLTKLALFAPFWLLFLLLLSRFFEARMSVVLSLFIPVLGGLVVALLIKSGAAPFKLVFPYFGAINFRMIAVPSLALDLYGDFFSTHGLTYYCQINLLKPYVNCPYASYLSIVLESAYHFGNLNASLFATEGIASVGPIFAPLAVLACGLLFALVNRLSSGLPTSFILLSGGVLPHILLNTPLTTSLLTNGAAILFLLWYVMPRTIFEPPSDGSASP